jgi:hypothetical protein
MKVKDLEPPFSFLFFMMFLFFFFKFLRYTNLNFLHIYPLDNLDGSRRTWLTSSLVFFGLGFFFLLWLSVNRTLRTDLMNLKIYTSQFHRVIYKSAHRKLVMSSVTKNTLYSLNETPILQSSFFVPERNSDETLWRQKMLCLSLNSLLHTSYNILFQETWVLR